MISSNAMLGVESIGRLQQVIRRLSDLPRAVAAEAQEPLNRLLQEQFRNGTDPYGIPWASVTEQTIQRRKVSRDPTPLTDTRAMRRGTMVELRSGNRAGLTIRAGQPYAYFHQVGFRVGRTRVPARPVLPSRGLPASWRRVLDDAARRAARGLRA